MDRPFINTSTPSVDKVQYVITKSNNIYEYYKKLIDSYVLDFFTSSHWDNLPNSWKNYFQNASPEHLGDMLNLDKHLFVDVMPLSFLSLRALVCYLRIPRTYLEHTLNFEDVDCDPNIKKGLLFNNELTKDSKITKMFWKHVKIKKRHELTSFAEYTYKTALKTKCHVVVDVGAGLGHLCRLLSYGYGMQVCGIEAQGQLVHQAKKLDKEFEQLTTKYNPEFMSKKFTPSHLNMMVTDKLNHSNFLEIIRMALNLNGNNFLFGIVGLHPCGDLGPILLRLYKNCPNIRFVNIVGCCYMKLSCSDKLRCYPLSRYCIERQYTLSYHAREVACHAIESYTERLKAGRHWELKVHAYRATLEKIIVQKYPHLRHVVLANVKYTPEMTFPEYCSKALKKLNVALEEEDMIADDIKECLERWKHVVTFYTIRLLFAPLIETLIILDRFLYLQEDGQCAIATVFDPKLSPRNYVVSGLRF